MTERSLQVTCRKVEIDGPRATLRLRLNGMALADLAQLSRALAGVDA